MPHPESLIEEEVSAGASFGPGGCQRGKWCRG